MEKKLAVFIIVILLGSAGVFAQQSIDTTPENDYPPMVQKMSEKIINNYEAKKIELTNDQIAKIHELTFQTLKEVRKENFKEMEEMSDLSQEQKQQLIKDVGQKTRKLVNHTVLTDAQKKLLYANEKTGKG